MSLFTMIMKNVAIIVLLSLSPASIAAAAQIQPSPVRVDLAVSFDIEAGLVRGTSRIEVEKNQDLHLLLPDLKVTAALLSSPTRENAPLVLEQRNSIRLEAASEPRTLLISYEKHIDNSFNNSISDKAIILTSDWHPVVRTKAVFSLKAIIPDGFTALSQADQLSEAGADHQVHFTFSQPLYALSFVAAPYVKSQLKVRDGLQVYTLFFKEEQELATGYLHAAADYIRRYERLIGPFPYSHYVIAENVMPTGYGFPTFTLLGQQVIRLPFIKETSLGHEILHSWFGNNIDIAEGSGNWCEGLTTYLADMAYRSEAGEGAQARKEAIQHYQDYITDSAPTLNKFFAAGHDRQTNQAKRAVGYQKSAMLFHELSRLIGEAAFFQSIQELYQGFTGRSASWQDLRRVFEKTANRDLSTFFSQRLSRNDLPALGADDVEVRKGRDRTTITLTISQKQSPAYELLLPVLIRTLAGETTFQSLISEASAELSYQVDSTPLEIVIDPEYDLLRRLTPEEDSPAWSSLLGTDKGLVVVDEDQKERYQSFLSFAESNGWRVKSSDDLEQRELEEKALVFLGPSNTLKTLFANPQHPETGFTVDIRVNPFNPELPAALISSSSDMETEAVVNRLPHYGKYSYLHFDHGRIVDKRVPIAAMGIKIQLEERPAGIFLPELSGFEQMVDRLSENRVVYIGETHTSRPDHLLQIMLIEALYERNKNLAIGMEMFPRASQPALDRYINDPGFSEADFIKEARYYQVWGYDYRLFRPIFAFARKYKIPVIGLNIDREIVSSVFKSGSIKNLTAEQQEQLPSEMRLDIDGYVARLTATHRLHSRASDAEGSLPGFIQAQALWDETMAESVASYLLAHPQTQMVVLAGSQHTRKDSGIPPRVAARVDAAQASVLNQATSGGSAGELSSTADYLFFLNSHELEPQGKIGIVLQEQETSEGTQMEIVDITAQGNAGAAGIQEDDILIFIDELAIHTMDDVYLALLDRAAGDTVRVSVLRGSGRKQKRIDMEVMLYNPNRPPGHP